MAVTAPALGGMRCLVLGAGGFLGNAVASALRDAGAVVQGYGHASGEAFSDAGALARAIEGQTAVFHVLGSAIPDAANRDPAGDLAEHVYRTLKMLELCRGARVRKVVFASSGGTVYGIPAIVPTPETVAAMPISAYAISKLAIEEYLALYRRLHGLDYQVLRIGNAYGPGQLPLREQGVVAATLYRALSGQPIEVWGSGETTRDFVYIDDVAAAFVQVLEYTGDHRVMNVGSGIGRTVNALVADVKRLLNLPDVAIVSRPERATAIPTSVLDTSLIERETAWRPRVEWLDGLERTAAWIRRRYEL